jgi:hypothetical protein
MHRAGRPGRTLAITTDERSILRSPGNRALAKRFSVHRLPASATATGGVVDPPMATFVATYWCPGGPAPLAGDRSPVANLGTGTADHGIRPRLISAATKGVRSDAHAHFRFSGASVRTTQMAQERPSVRRGHFRRNLLATVTERGNAVRGGKGRSLGVGRGCGRRPGGGWRQW